MDPEWRDVWLKGIEVEWALSISPNLLRSLVASGKIAGRRNRAKHLFIRAGDAAHWIAAEDPHGVALSRLKFLAGLASRINGRPSDVA